MKYVYIIFFIQSIAPWTVRVSYCFGMSYRCLFRIISTFNKIVNLKYTFIVGIVLCVHLFLYLLQHPSLLKHKYHTYQKKFLHHVHKEHFETFDNWFRGSLLDIGCNKFIQISSLSAIRVQFLLVFIVAGCQPSVQVSNSLRQCFYLLSRLGLHYSINRWSSILSVPIFLL